MCMPRQQERSLNFFLEFPLFFVLVHPPKNQQKKIPSSLGSHAPVSALVCSPDAESDLKQGLQSLPCQSLDAEAFSTVLSGAAPISKRSGGFSRGNRVFALVFCLVARHFSRILGRRKQGKNGQSVMLIVLFFVCTYLLYNKHPFVLQE